MGDGENHNPQNTPFPPGSVADRLHYYNIIIIVICIIIQIGKIENIFYLWYKTHWKIDYLKKKKNQILVPKINVRFRHVYDLIITTKI